MITEIGIVAGEIWHFLEKKQSIPLDTIVDGLKRNRDLVLMSLGWLSREGHVTLAPTDRGYLVTLNKR